MGFAEVKTNTAWNKGEGARAVARYRAAGGTNIGDVGLLDPARNRWGSGSLPLMKVNWEWDGVNKIYVWSMDTESLRKAAREYANDPVDFAKPVENYVKVPSLAGGAVGAGAMVPAGVGLTAPIGFAPPIQMPVMPPIRVPSFPVLTPVYR